MVARMTLLWIAAQHVELLTLVCPFPPDPDKLGVCPADCSGYHVDPTAYWAPATHLSLRIHAGLVGKLCYWLRCSLGEWVHLHASSCATPRVK